MLLDTDVLGAHLISIRPIVSGKEDTGPVVQAWQIVRIEPRAILGNYLGMADAENVIARKNLDDAVRAFSKSQEMVLAVDNPKVAAQESLMRILKDAGIRSINKVEGKVCVSLYDLTPIASPSKRR